MNAGREIIFEVKRLNKSFDRKSVIENFDFQLKSGDFVTLVGRNGAGKSTLTQILSKRLDFDSGEVLYRGKSIQDFDSLVTGECGYITTQVNVLQELSISQYLEIYADLGSKCDPKIVDELLHDLGLDKNMPLRAMSLGQYVKAQFVFLAAQRPRCYFIDEATAVLDSGSRLNLIRFLKAEADRGCLVVLCTNLANEAEFAATDIMVIESGKLIYKAPKERIRADYKKFRIPSVAHSEDLSFNQSGARPVAINSDDSISLIVRVEDVEKLKSSFSQIEEDLRIVTIEDVSKYFSLG